MDKDFFKAESGQGLAEYSLILSLIVLAVIAILTGVGGSITGLFQKVNDKWP